MKWKRFVRGLQAVDKKPKLTAFVAAIIAFGGLGVILIASSHAATYASGQEAESGILAGNAQKVPDTSASGGSRVDFGAATGGGSTMPGADGPADASKCTKSAADTFAWGQPQYASYFNTPTLDPTWHPYGPEPGHQGVGTRTPAAISMNGDGTVSLNADGKGTTAAMKWFPGQKYGRWEVCMKVATGNQHYVLLTWPDAEDWPQGGEYDFFEESGGTSGNTSYLHCPTSSGGNCDTTGIDVDAKQWHAYAMEWSPGHVKVYVDGVQKTDYTGASAPRPMDLCIQLDYFGNGGTDSMTVDYAKQWPVSGSTPSTLGLAPGDPATGQPGTHPERLPRPLTIQQMRP